MNIYIIYIVCIYIYTQYIYTIYIYIQYIYIYIQYIYSIYCVYIYSIYTIDIHNYTYNYIYIYTVYIWHAYIYIYYICLHFIGVIKQQTSLVASRDGYGFHGAWVMAPPKANMARRPFFSSLSFISSAPGPNGKKPWMGEFRL